MEEGETVTGYLMSKPNEKKKRDLDITISYELQTEDEKRMAEGSLDYKM